VNVVNRLWERSECHGEHTALWVEGQCWSYQELTSAVSHVAERLVDSGVQLGDRILFVLPTSAEFVVAYHAVLAVGAVAVTVNTQCTAHELSYYIEDAGCALGIGAAEGAEALEEACAGHSLPLLLVGGADLVPSRRRFEPVRRTGDDLAVLLYTSGTTGRPKGAELTHHNLSACATSVATGLGLGTEERFGTALPLFHVYGQVIVMRSVLDVGGTLYLLRRFEPEQVLRLAAEHRLTLLAGVPTMWNDILDVATDLRRGDFASLRIALSGGAALPMEVARALDERFGCSLLEGYGLSEATGAATMNSPDGHRRAGSVGRALPGLEVSIRDSYGQQVDAGAVGEVTVRGPVLMRGYWRRPEATAEAIRDGWLFTGDLGRQDADGYLWIVDRKKDLVIRGGYNVYPREIEEVLYEHPAVREAAVIGIPDARLGEEVAAVVALRRGREVEMGELRAWLDERLAAYKTPRVYLPVDALPKGSTGKVLKRQIDLEQVLHQGVRTHRARR
jgi:long-chain acyl-CoA synthetase